MKNLRNSFLILMVGLLLCGNISASDLLTQYRISEADLPTQYGCAGSGIGGRFMRSFCSGFDSFCASKITRYAGFSIFSRIFKWTLSELSERTREGEDLLKEAQVKASVGRKIDLFLLH